MGKEQEELTTHEASQRSGMSRGYLASLLRQHKLEGSYDSKRRRWMVNADVLERFLTIEDKTGERRITYAKRLQQRAQRSVQEGRLAQAEPLYLKALSFFDSFDGPRCSESRSIRNELGRLYSRQQRYAEAETCFLQALEGLSESRDIHLLAPLLKDISDLYFAQDRVLDALPYLERQRRIVADRIQGVNDRIKRGRMLVDQQKYHEAFSVLDQDMILLQVSDILDAGTQSALFFTFICIFVLYDTPKKLHETLQALKSVIPGAERNMGDAELLYRLGESFRLQRRYWEAKVFLHGVLKLFEQGDEKSSIQSQVGLALKSLGQLHHEQANYPEAQAAYLRALSAIESLKGTEHPDVAFILHRLIDLGVDQGNYRDALLMGERAHAIEKHSPPELADRSPATKLYHEASCKLEQGQLAEAEALLQRALLFDEQEQGPDHSVVIDDLSLLAHVLLKQAKFAESEQFAQRALAISEQQEGKQTAPIVIQLHLLFLIARAQGKKQEADALQERITACNALEPGPDDIDAIFAFHTAALHAVTQGHYAEAEALIQHTLIVHEHVLGKEHRHVVLYLNQLAEIYCLQQKYQQAELLLIRILALSEQAEIELPLLVATSLYQLAQPCIAQRDITRAERLAERACQEAEQTLGSDHVVTGITLVAKAHVLLLQWKPEEADVLAKRAESLLTSGQTARSPFRLCADQALTQLYNDIARHKKRWAKYGTVPQYVDAEPLARQALREAERQLVADHPLLMPFLYSLAAALTLQKQYQEAEALYQRALTIAESVSEPAHTLLFALLQSVGEAYEEQEKCALAEQAYKQALEICEQYGDQGSSQMYMVIQKIGYMCMLQKKNEESKRYMERYDSWMQNVIVALP